VVHAYLTRCPALRLIVAQFTLPTWHCTIWFAFTLI
jgi:hypothetical protein